MDSKALSKLGYGLYVLTALESGKDSGCIVNTVLQVSSTPSLVGVITVNKQNFTHDMVMKSKKFNISVLTTETPFDVFKHFGFQSGATVDKFADCTDAPRSENVLIYLPNYINAYLSFEVIEPIDFNSHTMFKSEITGGEVISGVESLTYAYYQQFIKPKPKSTQKAGYRCNICGFVFVGEDLPKDFVCPLCKHGASDFVKMA